MDMIVEVFDPQGKNLHSITHPYKLLSFTDKDKENILTFYRTDPNFKAAYERIRTRLVFPAVYPAIQNFFVSDNKLNIVTFEKKENKTAIYVFETTGKFVKSAMVPLIFQNPMDIYPFWIAYGKMYQVIDNDDEEQWELHINEF